MEDSLVIQKRKRTVTTSLVVAEKFGKRHAYVVNKIEDLLKMDTKDMLLFRDIL